VQRQDVGTTVRITPHINQANDVRMEIEEEISERGATEGSLGVVSITKRKAKTEVMVRDQQTIVIGGLMRDYAENGQTRIPILGDIPVIGALFRRTRRVVRKTNLLLILTPYVIRDPSDLRTIFERKMRERQEFIDRYFVFGDQDYEPPIDYTRTRGLVLEMFREMASVDEEVRIEAAARTAPPPAHVPRPPVGDAPPVRDEERDMVITPEGISYDNPNPEPRPAPAPTPAPATAPTPTPTPAPAPNP
jgi:general secretion pathway protein D